MTVSGWHPRRAGVAEEPQWTPVGEIPEGPPGDSWENLPYAMAGQLVTRVGTVPYPVSGGTFEIVSVTARVGAAPMAGPTVIDVNVNGVSIYADPDDQPRIMPGTRLAVVGEHTTLTVADGDAFTVDVDAPGTLPASDLTVVIRLRRVGGIGIDGPSAYEVAVEQGFDGTAAEWLESLRGEDGEDGAPGDPTALMPALAALIAEAEESDDIAALTAAIQALVEAGPIAPTTHRWTTPQVATAWVIPDGATHLICRLQGAGGGGGSGKRGISSTVRTGGGGGGGGGYSEVAVPVGDVGGPGATLYITVGGGGDGGAARTTDDTNGVGGTNGTQTAVSKTAAFPITLANGVAYGGSGNLGQGGTAASAGAGSGGGGLFGGGAGGASSATGSTGNQGVGSTGGGPGGGAGAGLTASNGAAAGGPGNIVAGRASGGNAAGPAGSDGGAGLAPSFGGGGGGAGGGSSVAGAAGNGGAGGTGAGGGGGAASVNGVNSGAGGDGGDGYVEIICYY